MPVGHVEQLLISDIVDHVNPFVAKRHQLFLLLKHTDVTDPVLWGNAAGDWSARCQGIAQLKNTVASNSKWSMEFNQELTMHTAQWCMMP